MHYADGTEAKIGDIVRGTGYNVKDNDGKLREIEGVVIHLTPGADSCNMEVVHLACSGYPGGLAFSGGIGMEPRRAICVQTDIEYGACKDFQLVFRKKEPGK